jgi:chemotaxis methyl-accepting protein methylase
LRVFGTDVDPAQVALAMKAEYSRTNLNHVTLQRLARWFIQQGERYTLQDTIKENVEFSCFDLLDDELMYPPTSIFGGFDLVFCANLLFYYHIDAQHKILNKVNNSLNESGYLIVGEAERDILVNEGFVEILPHTGIFKKK